MILAVRDKFHHWAQGYATVSSSRAVSKHALSIISHSLQWRRSSRLSHDSSLILRITGCLSYVEHISVFTKARRISPAEYVSYHSPVMALYQGLLQLPAAPNSLSLRSKSSQSQLSEMTAKTITRRRIDRLIQGGCLTHSYHIYSMIPLGPRARVTVSLQRTPLHSVYFLLLCHFLFYVSVFRAAARCNCNVEGRKSLIQINPRIKCYFTS